MTNRRYTAFDRLCLSADRMLRTLVPGTAREARPSPAATAPANTPIGTADDTERRHTAGLMRVNHTGEVCAQALYQGQALTARDSDTRQAMEQSAREEIDHLAWCEQRLRELDSHTSVLNPLFYGLSFLVGATAGAVGDRWSLGFVAATEDQVCRHLESHLAQLPESDVRSRAILEQMLADEADHATKALAAGGARFAGPVKAAMTLVSRAMTATTYRL